MRLGTQRQELEKKSMSVDTPAVMAIDDHGTLSSQPYAFWNVQWKESWPARYLAATSMLTLFGQKAVFTDN